MQERIQAIFADSQRIIARTLDQLSAEIAQAAELIIQTYQDGGGVLIFGNGGSASDAQHIACELAGRFRFDRPALRAVALVSDAATLTSVANDYGYDAIFARQVEAQGRAGDIAIGMSTSGNSPNVVAGLEQARRMGLK
jgi:D-sedoheptulose 7-phosphate isomerase